MTTSNTESNDPKRLNERSKSDESECTNSNPSNVESQRTKLRDDNGDPKCEKAITDSEHVLPKSVNPNTGKELPQRTKQRNEGKESRCKKSKIVTVEPKRVKPLGDSSEPKHT